jgi:lipid-binding SYLF domain-containing protein
MRYTLYIAAALLLPGGVFSPAPAFGWEPDPSDKAQVSAAAELEAYKADEKIGPYIENAYAYAILPGIYRIAAGFGFNYGKGFAVAQDQLAGKISTYQATIGFTYGFEYQSQIILFRNREVFEIFETGRWEFQGRGGLAFVKYGTAFNPAFLPDVAIFSRTKAGLMVEAAAMASKYNYKPIQK